MNNSGITNFNVLNTNALYIQGLAVDFAGSNAFLQAEIDAIEQQLIPIQAITSRIDFNQPTPLVGNLVITEENKNSVLLTAIQNINTQIGSLNKLDLTALPASPPGACIITPTTTNQALKGLIDTINNSITTINTKLAHFSTFNYGTDVMSGIADGTGFAAAVSGGSAAGNGLFVYPNTTSQTAQIQLRSDNTKEISIRGGEKVGIYGGSDGTILSRNVIEIGDATDDIRIGRNQGIGSFPLVKIGVDSGPSGNASTTTFEGDMYVSSYSAYVPGLTPVLYADTTPGVKLGNVNNLTTDPTFSGLDVIGVGVAPITLSAATGVIAVTALLGGITMTTGAGLMSLACGAGGFSLSTGAGALSMNTGAGLMNLATSSANIEMSTLTGNVSIGPGKATGGSAGNLLLNAAGDVIIQPDVETEIYKTAFVEFNDNAAAPATTANRLYQQADELYWNGQQVSNATPKLYAGHDILIEESGTLKSIATNTYEFPTQTSALGSLFPTPSQLGYSNVKIFSDIGDPTPISNGLWNLNMRPTGTLGFPTFSNIPPIVRSATEVIFFDDANGGVHIYNPSTLDWTYNVLSVNRNDTTPLFFRSASVVPVRAGLPVGYNNGGLLVSGNFNAARVGTNPFTTNIRNGVFFWDFVTTSVDTLGLTSATNFEMVVEAVPVTTWQLAGRNVLFFAAATTLPPQSFSTQLLSYVFDGAAGATDTLVSNNVFPTGSPITFNQEVTIGTFTLASPRTYTIAVNSFLGNGGASPVPAKIGIYLFNGTQEILQGSTISYNIAVSVNPYNQTFPAFNYPATTAGQQYRIKIITAFQQVPVTSTQVSGATTTPFCLAQGTAQGNWTFVDNLGYSLTRRVNTLAAYSTASQCWVFMGGNQFRSANNLNYAQLVYFAASAANFIATSVNNITAATGGAWNTARFPGITQSNFDASGNLYFCGDFTQNATITQTPYNFLINDFAVTLSGMRGINTSGGNGDFIAPEAFTTFFAPNNVVNTIRATMPAVQVIPYLYENVATYGQNPSLTGINVPLNVTQVGGVTQVIEPNNAAFLGSASFTYDELIIFNINLPPHLNGQNPVLQYMDIWLPASTQIVSLNIQLFLDGSLSQFANYSRNIIGGQLSPFLSGPSQRVVSGNVQISLFRVYAIDLFGGPSFPRPFTTASSFRVRVTINVPPTLQWAWRTIFPTPALGARPPMTIYMSRAENPMTNVGPGDQQISVSVPTLTIPSGANYRFGFLPIGLTNINQAWMRAGFIGGGVAGIRYTAGLDAVVVGAQVDNSAYVPAIAGIPQFNNMIQIPATLGTRPSFAVQSLVANNLQNIFKCCVGANGSTLNVVEWNASTPTQNPLGIGLSNALVTIGRDTNDGTGNSVFIVARSATSSNPFIAAYHFTTRNLSNVLRFQTSFRYNTGQLGITANEVIFEGRFSTIELTADDNNRNSWVISAIQGNVDFSTFN